MLSVDSDANDTALLAVQVDLPHLPGAGQGEDGELCAGLKQGNTNEHARIAIRYKEAP